jgi:hypothetical protein
MYVQDIRELNSGQNILYVRHPGILWQVTKCIRDAQKYGYLTVGGTVCTCIRLCTQTDMFPLPLILGEVSQCCE